MISNRHFGNFIREHKPLFTAVLVGLFLLELEIYVIAATRSGTAHSLVITDTAGQVVYETAGRDVGAFNPETFEKTFGPIENYHVRRVSRQVPFPFRAWFVAAVGIPVGGMLLFAFIVRAFVAVFQGDGKRSHENEDAGADTEPRGHANRLDRILNKIGRLNIFTMGFFIFLIVISYWVLPNTLAYLGRVGIDTVTRYHWLFLGGAVTALGLFIWIVYLRYLLARKHIETQAELDRYRLQLQLGWGDPGQLPPPGPGKSLPLLTENPPPEKSCK